MKIILRFIGIFLLFIAPITIFYTAKALWLMKDDKYKATIYGNEIYRAISKSKKQTTYRKLILGDSTANQFYNCKEENPDSAYSLTCNQAIGMVGQYLLLNNYLATGNRPDTVYIVYTPFIFWDNLDQVYTYHYFLKPFYYNEYKPLMTETVKMQIKKIPKYRWCHIPYILTTAWASTLPSQARSYSFLSPICREYLSKIDSLSNLYNFQWEVVPTFVAEHWRDSVSHFKREEYAPYHYADKLDSFLSHIVYLPDSCFVDDVHLKSPHRYQRKMDSLLHLKLSDF